MKKIYIFLAVCLSCGINTSFAQVNTYTFNATTALYTPTSVNATQVFGPLIEGNMSTAVNIGFPFTFDGSPFTQCKISALGYMTFDLAATAYVYDNALSMANGDRPMIAPLYDDIKTGAVTGGVHYETTGVSPNRQFTVEWRNMRWWWTSSDSVITFQATLYETTNVIRFAYHSLVNSTNIIPSLHNGGATIGIAGMTTWLDVLDPTANPATSSSMENDSIALKPQDNQFYVFTPSVLDVHSNTLVSAVRLFPVPAQTSLTISDAENISSIEVVDVWGNLMLAEENKGVNSFTITVAEWNSGVYFLRLTGKDGAVTTKKIVKE
ncbi:hypothetical protein BH11BAC7_BH11BAC7_30590 [soil metagenome]